MPGDLPPTSGYTYALDLTLRDCLAPCTTPAPALASPWFETQGGASVALYVTNFLGLAGTPSVPTGSYDPTKGQWNPETSGALVVTTAARPAWMSTAEWSDLQAAVTAGRLAAGAYMRVPLAHLSNWDLNWGIVPPFNARRPPPPRDDTKPDDPCEAPGSILGCESQSLAEEIPITGTSLRLRYQSNRTPGYLTRIRFPIADSDANQPAMNRVLIEVQVAGRKHSFLRTGTPRPNEMFTFAWDGIDAYGRRANGTHRAKIRVGYEFAATSLPATAVFGRIPTAGAVGNRAARTFTYWSESEALVSRFDARDAGFGGWTLSGIDKLDLGESLAVEQGDGKRRTLGLGDVASTSGLVDNFNPSGTSLPIQGVVSDASNNLYVALSTAIIRRSPTGTVTVLAGTTTGGVPTDNRIQNGIYVGDRKSVV